MGNNHPFAIVDRLTFVILLLPVLGLRIFLLLQMPPDRLDSLKLCVVAAVDEAQVAHDLRRGDFAYLGLFIDLKLLEHLL